MILYENRESNEPVGRVTVVLYINEINEDIIRQKKYII